MMLRPSIDALLNRVDSKYSLVVLEAKRAHELRAGGQPTMEFKSAKATLRALEEIEAGTVTIHPNADLKRQTLAQKEEVLHLYKMEEERRIKELIAQEEREEESKSRGNKSETAKEK
ncbi:DNA-directed RNA polymerase subunit omega [Lactovum miscens]|uniref:DNA-directed RNA polymerase subunit omega n=1 Tax=Lactovum miscens TaxID=190387 RepID=A0A841C6I6_9LACT|nr:DNA-directed RNA polymerase subunit omega [Lactovum miscens]MBB5887161.1 DNA-directed RNA polymerase subunit omega [Lactovum miscens]